jgi:hypothetical protein
VSLPIMRDLAAHGATVRLDHGKVLVRAGNCLRAPVPPRMTSAPSWNNLLTSGRTGMRSGPPSSNTVPVSRGNGPKASRGLTLVGPPMTYRERGGFSSWTTAACFSTADGPPGLLRWGGGRWICSGAIGSGHLPASIT